MPDINQALIDAVEKGAASEVKQLLANGANPNQFILSSRHSKWVHHEENLKVKHSLICYAVRSWLNAHKGSLATDQYALIADYLIKAGVDVNLYDDSEESSTDVNSRLLFLIAYSHDDNEDNRRDKLFQKLIDHGLDVTKSSSRLRNNVLHTSANSVNANRIKWLYSFTGFREAFQSQAINVVNKASKTPLDCLIENSVYYDQQDVMDSIELLVSNGAELTEFGRRILQEEYNPATKSLVSSSGIAKDILACILSHSAGELVLKEPRQKRRL